ncbi:protein Hook homolog 3-like isoform X2 [Bolinopsis microptera]|uniref:protein Hook homolog 3-like isoform X2 n=1 Tax=Bolinopsis microptera TaxID=2820187 RepID=UPI003079EC80
MPNDICDSLLEWLSTFDAVNNVSYKPKELTDGLVLSSVLKEIAPGWFDLSNSLKENINDNWRLKVSNLRKIKNAILDYYQEVLELDLVQFPMPDCGEIGEHAEEEHLGRLLQLVLGCAVHCDEKEEYIKKIMGLEEHVQTGVMQCIQELMEYEMPRNMGNMDYEKKLELSNNELESSQREDYDYEGYESYENNSYDEHEQIDLEKVEEFRQKIHDLEIQIQILQESNDTLHDENERLELKCKTDQSSMSHIIQSQGPNEQGNVSQLIEDFHAERYQLELARDDYKIKCESFESEITELTERCMELQEQAANSKRLKDEVDELKYRLTNTAKLEVQLESYKKKIEEIPDLRNQIRTLESQIDSYVMEKVSLEDENKRHTLYKNQLEKYKVDIRRLQEELLSETKRADKFSIEAEKYKAKCEATENDNFNLLQERSSLKEAVENMQYSNNRDNSLGGTNSFIEQNNHSGSVPPQTKEMIARLQKDNENLKMQVLEKGITDTDLELLRDELKDSKEYQQKVQEDLRVANQKIAMMESDIKIGSGNTATPTRTQELIQLQDNLVSEKSKHRDTVEMLEKKNNRIKELEPRVKSAAEAINSLKDIIKKKDDEIKTQEEKYKRFLGKAKQVIKAIDPKGSQSPSPDTAALRKQLAEKERALMRMEEEAERLKTAREREERMVLSAWYEMGMHVHKKGLEERLQPQMNTPRSLMSQKRSDMRRSTVSGKSPSTMR